MRNEAITKPKKMLLAIFVLLGSSVSAARVDAQFEAHVRSGIAALDSGKPAEAEREFEQATRLEPGSASAWLLLAQACAKQNKRVPAARAAGQAEKLGGSDPEILRGLAHFYSEMQPDPARAASLIVRYAEKNPEDEAAWRAAAALNLQMGQPERAIEAANRGLAVKNSAALRALLGRAYAERKEWGKATAELKETVKLDPYDEDAQFRLAQAYLVQQDFASAAGALVDAKRIFAASAQIELALGVAYYGMRNFSGAIEQFLRTTRLAPDLPQPYVFLGRILEHAGDRLPEAMERFAEFEKRNPKSHLGYVLHAKALINASPPGGEGPEEARAFALLQKSLSLKEDDAEAHYLMGTLLERRGEFQSAAAELERSIALNGKESAPHFRLARVYMRLGRREDAQRERALHEKLSEEERKQIGLGR